MRRKISRISWVKKILDKPLLLLYRISVRLFSTGLAPRLLAFHRRYYIFIFTRFSSIMLTGYSRTAFESPDGHKSCLTMYRRRKPMRRRRRRWVRETIGEWLSANIVASRCHPGWLRSAGLLGKSDFSNLYRKINTSLNTSQKKGRRCFPADQSRRCQL